MFPSGLRIPFVDVGGGAETVIVTSVPQFGQVAARAGNSNHWPQFGHCAFIAQLLLPEHELGLKTNVSLKSPLFKAGA